MKHPPPTYLGASVHTRYFVYILTDADNRRLYTGVTNDLRRRIRQHKSGHGSTFTKRYHVHKLVYYEIVPDPITAAAREKQIKAGSRQKKLDLITNTNGEWRELSAESA